MNSLVQTGEVWTLPLPTLAGPPVSVLQHTASIVTGLAVASGGSRLVSCDRDEKVRISQWPTTCLIDAFCLGHTEYVAAVAMAHTTHASPNGEVLVSISGDGSLRCWDPVSGACLAMHAFPDNAVPVALATSHANATETAAATSGRVAVAFAGSAIVAVLGLGGLAEKETGTKDGGDHAANTLSVSEVTLPSVPSALAFDPSGNLLALSDNAPYLHTIDCSSEKDGASLVATPRALATALASTMEEHNLKVG